MVSLAGGRWSPECGRGPGAGQGGHRPLAAAALAGRLHRPGRPAPAPRHRPPARGERDVRPRDAARLQPARAARLRDAGQGRATALLPGPRGRAGLPGAVHRARPRRAGRHRPAGQGGLGGAPRASGPRDDGLPPARPPRLAQAGPAPGPPRGRPRRAGGVQNGFAERVAALTASRAAGDERPVRADGRGRGHLRAHQHAPPLLGAAGRAPGRPAPGRARLHPRLHGGRPEPRAHDDAAAALRQRRDDVAVPAAGRPPTSPTTSWSCSSTGPAGTAADDAAHPREHPPALPARPRSPELNPVEHVWDHLRETRSPTAPSPRSTTVMDDAQRRLPRAGRRPRPPPLA